MHDNSGPAVIRQTNDRQMSHWSSSFGLGGNRPSGSCQRRASLLGDLRWASRGPLCHSMFYFFYFFLHQAPA